ncbi:MAG: glutathione S-transferase N-terminal domain-containing protein [Robiginitomaculum sp.]|nr:glutathione S-transferase N-terminal domain-containing protein [Robiginitomaculum sp.]
MTDLTLYIGNKNYSSWSMRPYLVLLKAELPFRETLIQLDVPGFKEKLLALSDAGTVPVLHVGDEMIPDSLAISDWAALCVPNLWPKDEKDRREARNMCLQMQEEFTQLRTHAPMNLRRRTRTKMPDTCIKDARQMTDIWEDCLSRHDGPFLFDNWSIVDAFATPYATRFVSYDIARPAKADTYISELMADEDYLNWEADALIEAWTLPDTDNI